MTPVGARTGIAERGRCRRETRWRSTFAIDDPNAVANTNGAASETSVRVKSTTNVRREAAANARIATGMPHAMRFLKTTAESSSVWVSS